MNKAKRAIPQRGKVYPTDIKPGTIWQDRSTGKYFEVIHRAENIPDRAGQSDMFYEVRVLETKLVHEHHFIHGFVVPVDPDEVVWLVVGGSEHSTKVRPFV